MRLLQQLILVLFLLSSGGNIWAEPIPFQEYEMYPILGTICAQLKEQVDKHNSKILHVSPENSYYFDVRGTRLFIDNIVTYSRYPVNPVNDIDNLRRYLGFLSHSLYIGNSEKEKNFELELIRTYPSNLYKFIFDITDKDFKQNSDIYNANSISIYICNLSEIRIDNKAPMKDSESTLALYFDHENRLIGYDFLGSEELQRKVSSRNKLQNSRIKKDWSLTGWQNYIYLPIDIGICVKQTVGEVIKAPLHLVLVPIANFILNDIEFSDKPLEKIGHALKLGVMTSKEDIKEIKYIWLYRFNKLNHQHKLKNLPLNFICEPLRELPLIGDHIPRDSHYSPMGTQTPGYLFISRGIYGGSAEEQDTKNWEQFMKNILIEDINTKEKAAINELNTNNRKSVQIQTKTEQTVRRLQENNNEKLQVCSIPYRYGSILDILWSLLNISSGFGYEMAYHIVNEYEIGSGDVIFLTGHSGGVQRCLVAEKLLLENQIHTQRRVGLAGPSQGIVYWSRKTDNQNYITFLNQNHDYMDIVSNLNIPLDIIIPTNWIWRRNEEKIKIADPTLRHITPGLIDPKTRIPASGYLGKEYINFFSNSYVSEQLTESVNLPVEKTWWEQTMPQIFKQKSEVRTQNPE
ncbi:MAG: hypothetical protein ABH870_04725 [bacterium]